VIGGRIGQWATALLAMCAGLGGCTSTPTASPTVVAQTKPANIVLSVEDWSYADRAGEVIRTEHYRIYTTATNHQLRAQSPAFLELAYTQYTSALADLPAPTLKLDTYLLDSRWQWARLTRQLMGDEADLYLRIGRGGYAASGRAVLYDIGPRDTLSIAAHEGWHQYTQRTFQSRLPVWLEEGVATYMEGFRTSRRDPTIKRMLPWANIERFDQLRRARARGQTLGLSALLQATPESLIAVTTEGTLNYYAQVWALTLFLSEGEDGKYRDGLRNLLIDAAEGRVSRTVRDALGPAQARSLTKGRLSKTVFQVYFNRDLAAADKEYARFMNRVVRTGSRDLIVRGKSPLVELRSLRPNY
jgi:Protein of unknown function (DUF1570)